MYLLGSLVSALILGGICSYIAKQQGRHPILWFVAGFLFGVVAVLALFILFLISRKRNLNMPPVPASGSMQSQAVAEPEQTFASGASPSTSSKKLWYFLDDQDKQYGPMSYDALKKAWSEQEIKRKTFVWNEDMSEWKTVEDLPDLLIELAPSSQ